MKCDLFITVTRRSSKSLVSFVVVIPSVAATSCPIRSICKPGSINSLFGDLFREFRRGILEGVRDYLGTGFGRFLEER